MRQSSAWGWLVGIGLVLAEPGSTGRLWSQEGVAHIPLRVRPASTQLAPAVSEPGDCPLPINLPTALSLANVRPLDILLAQQRPAEAQRLLSRWLPAAEAGGRIGHVIEMLILQSLALYAQDETAEALTTQFQLDGGGPCGIAVKVTPIRFFWIQIILHS